MESMENIQMWRATREEFIMNENTVYAIEKYLKDNNITDLSITKSKMTLRVEGKQFLIREHIEAMLLALISGGNKWYKVERQLVNIKRLFFEYEPDKILKHDGNYYFNGLKNLGVNGRFAKRQMAEVHHNIKVLQSLDNDYGSIDKFLESRPINEIVKILADFKSKYKLNQMGVALVCEYLRNVGIDTAKPDKHMMRMLGCERLGISSRKKASHYEVISAFYELSRETGMWAADLDYLFWCYCADGKAEICSANPKCDKCVIRGDCNKFR